MCPQQKSGYPCLAPLRKILINYEYVWHYSSTHNHQHTINPRTETTCESFQITGSNKIVLFDTNFVWSSWWSLPNPRSGWSGTTLWGVRKIPKRKRCVCDIFCYMLMIFVDFWSKSRYSKDDFSVSRKNGASKFMSKKCFYKKLLLHWFFTANVAKNDWNFECLWNYFSIHEPPRSSTTSRTRNFTKKMWSPCWVGYPLLPLSTSSLARLSTAPCISTPYHHEHAKNVSHFMFVAM